MNDVVRFWACLVISQVWAASANELGFTLALIWLAMAVVSAWTQELSHG